MPPTSARRLPLAASALSAAALIALLAGCAAPGTDSGASDPASPPSSSATPSAPSDGAGTPAPAPTAGVIPSTCETVVPESVSTPLTQAGWTYQEAPFALADITLDDGLLCAWGDATNDQVQIYGIAPVTADDALNAQEQLVASGWIREELPDGVYITEDPAYAVTVDAEGYGMTYFFGDGWVSVSDTKEGLLVIQHP